MLARTLDPEGGWIVRSHVGWGGERNTLYKGVESSPKQTPFKNRKGKPKKESPKRTNLLAVDLGCYRYGTLIIASGTCNLAEIRRTRKPESG